MAARIQAAGIEVDALEMRSPGNRLRGIMNLRRIIRTRQPAIIQTWLYHADLIGLPVVTTAGGAIGHVKDVANYGATDIVEITLDPPPAKGMKTIMVPLIPAAVPEWDENRLVIASEFAGS